MTIYRIQDKFGRGPWKPGFSHQWVEDRDDHDNLLPMMNMGVFRQMHDMAVRGYVFGFGCKTVEQLRRWITPTEYQKLREFGYRAVKMKVDHILQESYVQCAFARKKRLSKNVVVFRLYEVRERGEQ